MPATIEDIELHVRSYRSALKSTLEITINSLTNSHLKMEPILHSLAQNTDIIDTDALVYSLLRLPPEIDLVEKIIIGQTPAIFAENGFNDVEKWPQVYAPSRRRTSHYNKIKKLLAVFAGSVSDVDDLVNLLIAYQYQWNKFNQILHTKFSSFSEIKKVYDSKTLNKTINISDLDWQSFIYALNDQPLSRLQSIYDQTLNLRLQLLAGSWVDYTKATQYWYRNIARSLPQYHFSDQTIYFVSSNLHSLQNLITGIPIVNQSKILDYLKKNQPNLYQVWQQIQDKTSHTHPHDFLAYSSQFLKLDTKKIFSTLGINQIDSLHHLDINTQIFPVPSLTKSKFLDPRLKIKKPNKISQSKALIFNIDYPLGFTAYHILSELLQNIGKIKGVYILSKAAILNSEIGDIQIPRTVFDEHNQNTYIFKNCFNSFFPYINQQGSILTNQKGVSVLSTFLENQALLKKYSEHNFTIIEMESGSYLSALAESTYDQPVPKDTIIDLNSSQADIGIINYASDTPYSHAKNLGANHLTLNGVEPVYISSLAIIQRIINLEEESKS